MLFKQSKWRCLAGVFIGILSGLFLLSACTQSTTDSLPNLPPTGREYDFIVLGDNRPDLNKLELFFNGANRQTVSLLVHLGDMVQNSSSIQLDGYIHAKSVLNSSIQVIELVGNHDVTDSNNGNTTDTLSLFNTKLGYATDSLQYQYDDFETFALIKLNSYLPGEEYEIGETQMTWLEGVLDTIDPETLIFVFLHHPPFPAGAHEPLTNRDAFHALLRSYNNVVAVFSGHEHLFYEQIEDGIHYIVSGGAGSPLHSSTENGIKRHHMLGVKINPFSYDLMDENGDILNL